MKITLATQMRQIDAAVTDIYKIPNILLMENAGRAAADAVIRSLGGDCRKANGEQKKIAVLSGGGNNGGDALAATRHLDAAGFSVNIFFLGKAENLSTAAKTMLDICQTCYDVIFLSEREKPVAALEKALPFADAILDGLLGTGFSGKLREPLAAVIAKINEYSSQVPIIAIDIPSGIDADSGAGEIFIRAAATVTLGLPKPGLYFSPGRGAAGNVAVDKIGFPAAALDDETLKQELLDAMTVARLIKPRPLDAYKGSVGRVLVVAGSLGLTGAAYLSSLAALKIGAGLVTLAVPASLAPLFAVKCVEVMPRPVAESAVNSGTLGKKSFDEIMELAANADSVLIGPGLGRTEETQDLILRLVATLGAAGKSLVLDADALYAVAGHTEILRTDKINATDDTISSHEDKDNFTSSSPHSALLTPHSFSCRRPLILTPHRGELARLLTGNGEKIASGADFYAQLRRAAHDWNAIIVAKGECTLIACPDGMVYFSPAGHNGMATAGAGDVLAGAIAGIIAETPSLAAAACAGTFLHGTAGEIAAARNGLGLVASDILVALPQARKMISDGEK